MDSGESTQSQQGISGRWFLMVLFSMLALFFIAGALMHRIYTGDPLILTGFDKYLSEVSGKYLIILLSTVIFGEVMFHMVLDTPLNQLPSRFRESGNNSYAYVFVGVLVSGLILVNAAHGASPAYYLFLLMTRGSLGFAMGALVACGIAQAFGVRSLDKFRDWVCRTNNNDNFAIITMAAFNVALAIAMHA